MSTSPETGWGAAPVAEPTYAAAALAILNYMTDSQQRIAIAARFDASFGGTVIAERQSLLAPEQSDYLRDDVNEAVAALNGIHAMLDDTPVTLMRWMGPNPEQPNQEMWLGRNPSNPAQAAYVSVGTASLRADYEERLSAA